MNNWRDEKGSKRNLTTGEFNVNQVECTLLRQSGQQELNPLVPQENASSLSIEQQRKTRAFHQAFQDMGGICKQLFGVKFYHF